MGVTIRQFLPTNIFRALIGAVSASASNLFATIADIKNTTIVQTTTSSSHTGNTAETILYTSPLITANTIASGDIIELFLQASKINTASNVDIKVYTNATPDLVDSGGSLVEIRRTRISAANLSITDFHKFLYKGSNNGVMNVSPIGELTSYIPSGAQNTRTISTRTIFPKFNEARYLLLTVTLIDTTDTVTLEGLQLKRDRV